MMVGTPLQREGAVDLAAKDIRVRAGFRVTTLDPLAGGPVELQFFVESLGSVPLHLAVSGDRARQRPGQFSFEAAFAGTPLEDPMSAATYLGGPATVVAVSASSPWRQALVLNEFVRLERTRAILEPEASGRLALKCLRAIALAATDAAALSSDEPHAVSVDLGFTVRRDDAALAALIDRLMSEVMHGPVTERERPLALLLSLRSTAQAQIDALAHHPDPSVSDRARHALGRSQP